MENYYTCAICGKEYDTIEERAKCESKCLADAKREAELMMIKKEAETRKKDEKIVLDALDTAEEAMENYFKEYDRLSTHKNYPYLKALFNRNTWWF